MRIKGAYRILFRSKFGLCEVLVKVKVEYGGHVEIDHFVQFIEGSECGVVR